MAFYWSGPGWTAAYEEARRQLDTGASLRDAAAAVGWTEQELKEAISRNGAPSQAASEIPPPRERPKRTVKQRVEGLHDVSDKTLRLARRLYELEIMTVREVSRAIDEPYEKTYLILIKAGTKFRRPGRRKIHHDDDALDTITVEVAAQPDVPTDRQVKKPRRATRRVQSEAVDRALRVALRGHDAASRAAPQAEKKRQKHRGRTPDADRALRLVLRGL